MNFNEFFDLIEHGVDEITLTEDIVFEGCAEELFKNGLIIEDNLTINGNCHKICFDNEGDDFNIEFKGSHLIFNDLYFSEGKYENCIFINVNSKLTMKNCRINNHIAINSNNASLNIEDCYFENNHFVRAYVNLKDSTLNLKNSKGLDFESANCDVHCVSSQISGIKNSGGSLSLNECHVDNLENNSGKIHLNQCIFSKKGIQNVNGVIKINDCHFDKIKSNIFNESGLVEVYGSKFENIHVFRKDCGVIKNFGKMIVHNCIFKNNEADFSGTIYNEGNMEVVFSKFTNETSRMDAKSIFNKKSMIIDSCEFISPGEAIVLNKGEQFLIKDSAFEAHHKLITNDNYLIEGDDSKYNILKYAEGSYLQKMLDEGNKHIFLDSYVFASNIKLDCDNLVIDGCGNTIDAFGEGSIFYIDANNVTLKNINFVNVSSDVGGAVFTSSKSLKIENCIFENNVVKHSFGGGAICNDKGNLDIAECVFKGNIADFSNPGGAIFNKYGNVTVVNSVFEKNIAGNNGGAIYQKMGYMKIFNCVFDENRATYRNTSYINDNYGSAVHNQVGSIEISDCIFKNHSNEVLYNLGHINLKKSVFKSEEWKPIIHNVNNCVISNCKFDDNHTMKNDYKLHIDDSRSFKNIINNAEIYPLNNDSFRYLYDLNAVNCEDIILDSNIAIGDCEFVDVIEFDKDLTIDGQGHTINGNFKPLNFSINDANVVFKNIRFVNFFALGEKKIVYSSNSSLNFENCIFEDINNSIFSIENSILNCENCTFDNNEELFECFQSSINFKCCILKDHYVHYLFQCKKSSEFKLIECEMKFSKKKDNVFFNDSVVEFIGCNFNNSHFIMLGRGCVLVDQKEFDSINGRFRFLNSSNNIMENNCRLNDLILSSGNEIVLDSHYIIEDLIAIDSDDFILLGNNHNIGAYFENAILKITSNNVLLKDIVFLGQPVINNFKSLTLENCSFKSSKIKINNYGRLTLKDCDFNNNTVIDNDGEVILVNGDEKEVLTSESVIITEKDDDEKLPGLGALFG